MPSNFLHRPWPFPPFHPASSHWSNPWSQGLVELCPNSSQSPTKLREVDLVGKLGLFNLVATESSPITVIEWNRQHWFHLHKVN